MYGQRATTAAVSSTYHAEILPVEQFAESLRAVPLNDPLTSRKTREVKHELHATHR